MNENIKCTKQKPVLYYHYSNRGLMYIVGKPKFITMMKIGCSILERKEIDDVAMPSINRLPIKQTFR